MWKSLPEFARVTGLLALAFTATAQDAIFFNMADTHSAYDAYPSIITAVESITAEHPQADSYVLFNGDLFELGNTVASRNAGELDWAFLERLNETAQVILNIGNHEFDFISYSEFISRADELGLTVIGGVVDAASGQPLQPAYVTVPAGESSVSILGLATDQLSTYPADVRETIQVASPATQLAAIPDTGADVYVLSHGGVVADLQVLEQIDPASTIAVVGGHDHLSIDTVVNSITYQHNGFRGEYLRVTELTATAGGWDQTSETVTASAYPADPAFNRLVAMTRLRLLESADLSAIGTVPADMTVREAADWATAALRDAVGADVALLNHTSFGSGLQAGPLSLYRFNEFMRFDNDVMVATVDAETMSTILAGANLDQDTPLTDRHGDFVYASPLEVEPGVNYLLVTSSWIALDFNQLAFLGVEGIEFTQFEGVTTKGLLAADLR